jgi:hypothetical protein
MGHIDKAIYAQSRFKAWPSEVVILGPCKPRIKIVARAEIPAGQKDCLILFWIMIPNGES